MSRSAERGFMLIVAMIILLVATLLVVGAIAFTGSERSAAANQVNSGVLSACTDAAKNLFLSRVNVLRGNVADVVLDKEIALGDGGTRDSVNVKRGHFDDSDAGVTISDVRRIAENQIGAAGSTVQEDSNNVGQSPLLLGYYNITALCTDRSTGMQQEVEFVVRLGL
ncbi:MAG TPA: hypothetical protein VE782_03405 [Myxococcaceae bacterium]|jgi:hypothetical protein|nr:hypothetical protein [Myxococcaceae bacterium]